MSRLIFIDHLTGRPVDNQNEHAGRFGGARDELVDLVASRSRGDLRGDALTDATYEAALSLIQRRGDEVVRDRRGDTAGSTLPGRLVQLARSIFETPFPPLDGMAIEHRAETAIGAQQTEYARSQISGQMAHYQTGQPIPVISDSVSSELTDVANFVSVVPWDVFQQQADSFSGMGRYSRLLNGARTTHMQGHNSIVFNGYTGTALRGLLTHPGIPRYFAFTDPFNSGTSGQTMVTEFNSYLAWVAANTQNVGRVTRCLIASKLKARYNSVQYGTLAPGSVWKAIVDQNPGVTFVEDMHSLNDCGPNGEHGVFAYNSGDPLAAYYDLVQPPTFLPPQLREFAQYVYVYHTEAGFKSWNWFNTLLGFVPAAS